MLQSGSDYTFVFRNDKEGCYHCVKTLPRTLNVFEKFEGKFVFEKY